MAVIAVWLEFDGSAYSGWQFQPGEVSVQQKVEAALEIVCGQAVRVHSSGRTDAGVHARGMVLHFLTAAPLPLDAYLHGVNQHLPRDIAVQKVRRATDAFHARFSAIGKCYRYSIYRSAVRSPLHEPYSWHCKKPLDLGLMRQAAGDFIGVHDFASFRGSGCSAKTTIRRIDSIEFGEDRALLHLDVCGSGFLRHMVRMMVGTLVQIGAKRRPVTDVMRLLTQPKLGESRLTAPGKGLCLQWVEYPEGFWGPDTE
jgi:tRNA pseudouridine38-40 synthase